MFRFRTSTSSASSPFPTPSPKSSQPALPASTSASSIHSTADSLPSNASSSSILSLLHAHSSSTSLASLASEPCLTVEPLVAASETNEPSKPASPARTSTPRTQRPHATASPRKSALVTSPPRTARASTTTIPARPSSTSASRRSTILHTSTEHRSSHSASMTKKAKVGSAAKTSPFAKLAVAEAKTSAANDVEATTLAAVAEDEPVLTTTAASTKPAEAASSESKQNVVVCVRMRPSRTSSTDPAVWTCDPTKNQIVPTEHHPAIAKRTTSTERAGAGASIAAAPSAHDLDADDPTSTYHFQFDKLITGTQTTDDMYHSHIAPVVRAAMDGYNGTVFAYGQTGSGKTHTMSGSDAEPGVIPRAVQQVFELIAAEPAREFLLRVSYLEIYNETLKDLLAPLPPLGGGASLQTTERPASPIKGGSTHAAGQAQTSTLRIIEDQKQNRVMITGLREEIVTDAATVLALLQRGQDERHVGATDWNERSSRSHCVFQLTIESRTRDALAGGGKEVRISQLNLIDLAGSERAATHAERRKEGAFINKSLLTLGTVIGKLTEPCEAADAHIPYRDSKLTRILQTSLAGNARIAVICTLSPDTDHANETLSTLKFGKRCKLVVTTAKKGTAMDDKALLQKYRKELDALRARLEANGASAGAESVVVGGVEESRETQLRLEELEQQRQAAQREVEHMQSTRTQLRAQIEHLTRLILTSHSVAADASEGAAGPSTPVRARAAHALARRGPRLSDLHFAHGTASGYNSPIAGPSTDTLSGMKPFELEAELAALRRQLRHQIEARQTLITAHSAELAARDARHAELQHAIRLNEQELDEAELAYDKLQHERDEARQIALKEQDKARENRKKLLEEQEANRLLKLVAKARADDADKVLQDQIDVLRERLASKGAEVEETRKRFEAEIAEARKVIEAEKAARMQAEREADEAGKAKQALQAELEQAVASVAELKQKQAPTNDDDDVNAEFQDLVRGTPSSTAEQLKQRESELADRQSQLEHLRTELAQTRLDLQHAKSQQSTLQLATLRDELSQSEDERHTLQVELAKARAAASGRESDAQKLAALEQELAGANAKISELQTEIAAEKARSAEALAKVARPLPVPLAETAPRGGAGGSVPSSPVKALAAGGSKLRPGAPCTPTALTPGLNRAGSVKEYRRYTGAASSSSTPPSPTPASGSRSVLLQHQASSALLGNKAEKEEIERLNAVISSQRAIMADLEKSVASWKTRMKAQAELIHKLVVQNSGSSPPASDAENDELPSTPRKHTAPENFHTLPRTTHLALSTANNEPYYGAHTFNRPPPAQNSPTKPFASTFGSTWTPASPNPLPLPGGSAAGDGSPSKRKPRKTIEMDLKLLKSSPRVESHKSKFSLDYGPAGSQDTPTKRRGTNASAYYI
ncbi:probable kinesin motor protein 1 [Sporisorium reilianum SRZ2]|uniref:Probable kinesin motor protein 1 n=1 Tax=Sporisorium reilianum (strain SRZ2) TaxID=999809 RepID=E6ZSX6_SPORE|nr:probable kinesin motor protein 1 [Sporisorium reilianum SRZ2]